MNAQQEAHKAARATVLAQELFPRVFTFDRVAADEVLVNRAIHDHWSDAELANARQWLAMICGVAR
jgi:hypothetical protein